MKNAMKSTMSRWAPGFVTASAMVAGVLFAPSAPFAPFTSPAQAQAQAQAQVESAASLPLLDPNMATREELVAVPHINETLMMSLVERRPFLRTFELHQFLDASLDSTQLATVYEHLFLPIDLNAATAVEIRLVPGVGPKMKHEFEEYRPYKSMAQFRKEIGKYVDSQEVARLARYVFVPIELNTASDEEILAIPGVGKKMLHEFKEYRPYVSLVQFRKEIGKYVDEKELARLERYVRLEGAVSRE